MVDAVHSKDSRIYVQINHAGRAAFTFTNGGLKTWSPSPLKIRDFHPFYKTDHETPHEMTIE